MKVYARTPLNLDRVTVPRGQVFIIPERCKGCEMCVRFCPNEIIQISEAINAKGYHYPEIVQGKEDSCVHCEFCTLVCPEFAIYSLPVDGITS